MLALQGLIRTGCKCHKEDRPCCLCRICFSSLCSFRRASPRLWNELLKELRKPVDDESLSLSSHLSLTGSSSSSSSILSLCITPSVFHSRLKTYLFHKSFPPSSPSPFWTDLTDFYDQFLTSLLIGFLLFCCFHFFVSFVW